MKEFASSLFDALSCHLDTPSTFASLLVSKSWYNKLIRLNILWERMFVQVFSERSRTEVLASPGASVSVPSTGKCLWRDRFIERIELKKRWHAGKPKKIVCERTEGAAILCFRIDSVGGKVVSSGRAEVFVNDLYTGALLFTLAHHAVHVLELDLKLRRVVTASRTVEIKQMALLWDLDSGRLLARTTKHHLDGGITAMKADASTHNIYLGYESGAVRVYSMDFLPTHDAKQSQSEETKTELCPPTKRFKTKVFALPLVTRLLAHALPVQIIVGDSLSCSFVTSSVENIVIWDTITFERRITLDDCCSLIQCDAGQMAFAYSQTLKVVDLRSGHMQHFAPAPLLSSLKGLRFTGDAIIGMADDFLGIWSVKRPEHLRLIDHKYFVTHSTSRFIFSNQLQSVAVDVDGKMMFSITDQGEVSAWKIQSGSKCFSFYLHDFHEFPDDTSRLLIGGTNQCLVTTSCNMHRSRMDSQLTILLFSELKNN